MARDSGRPDGYDPALQISLRTRVEGGALRIPAEPIGRPDTLARRECLVLVHGFNQTDGQAARGYHGFRERQDAVFAPASGALDARLADAYWPGDAAWWWVFDHADFLVYPRAVETAIDAAPPLAALVRQLPNLVRVDFIAHSLGCRLVLETMRLLHAAGSPHIGRVCLMAPAVPSEFLEYPERYYDLLTALEDAGTEIRVLHSLRDGVLHWAFPPGQALAGEASVRALGRHGPTPGMPGWGGRLTEREIVQAGHGDYWGHSGSDASKIATEDAGMFLRLGDYSRELAMPRDLPAPAAAVSAREVGSKRRGEPARIVT